MGSLHYYLGVFAPFHLRTYRQVIFKFGVLYYLDRPAPISSSVPLSFYSRVMWLKPMEDRSIHYLPFTSDYLEKASEVYAECFNGPPWFDGWTHDTAKARLSTLLDYPNSIGVVAIHSERVIGFVLGNCEPWSDGIS